MSPKLIAAALAAIALVACSGSQEPAPAPTNDRDAAISEDSAPVTDTGSVAEDAPVDTDAEIAAKPATPTVVSVAPMSGSWHVTWKTNDTGLSKVELWRSNDGAAATLVKALAGTAKDWHDGAATGNTVKYCYTVRTFRGAEASDMSPEKCSK